MTQNKLTFDNYSKHLNRLIPTPYHSLLDYDKIHTSYEEEFRILTKYLTDEEFAAKYHKNIFVEGTAPKDYLGKYLEFNVIEFVTTIRFFNRKHETPYVYLDYYSCDTKYFFENWIEIRRIIFKEYDVFNLNKIRLSLRTEDKNYFENFKPALDQGMYVAPIANLIKSEIHSKENLRIEKIEQMTKEDYVIYTEEYNKFRDANPQLTSIASEPLETINQHCQKDYGFKLYVNEQWAGFALYASIPEYYLYGYLVWDKIIFEKFRSQNLSVYLQNQGFKEYVKDTSGFIYGTIEAENHGSIKTAEKSGRECLFGSYFFN
ncbi:MAG: hypothetical protein ACK58Q_15820 [Chitinophagales bacterium]